MFWKLKLNDNEKEISIENIDSVNEILKFLSNKCPELENYIKCYITIICKIFKLEYKEFIKICRMETIRYIGAEGIRWHFDNLTRGRNSQIVSISIGVDKIYYDLVPVYIKDEKEPVRVTIPDGALVILSDDARTKWTHGIPNNIPNYAGKFSILFKW